LPSEHLERLGVSPRLGSANGRAVDGEVGGCC
jgi:hypothetical protein